MELGNNYNQHLFHLLQNHLKRPYNLYYIDHINCVDLKLLKKKKVQILLTIQWINNFQHFALEVLRFYFLSWHFRYFFCLYCFTIIFIFKVKSVRIKLIILFFVNPANTAESTPPDKCMLALTS